KLIQILKFIDEDVIPPLLRGFEDFAVSLQQLPRQDEDVVEVDHAVGPQLLLVLLEQVLVDRKQRQRLKLFPAKESQKVLCAILADAQPPQDQTLVFLVSNAKAGGQVHLLRVRPEDLQAERVNRSERQVFGPRAEAQAKTCRHLLRRFVGEGDGADSTGIDALVFDEETDSPGETAGLSRAGAGQYQHRPDCGRYGFQLSLKEIQ